METLKGYRSIELAKLESSAPTTGWTLEGQRKRLRESTKDPVVRWGEEHLTNAEIIEDRLRGYQSSDVINLSLEENYEPFVVPKKYHPRNNSPLG